MLFKDELNDEFVTNTENSVLETLDNDALTVFIVLEIFDILRLRSLQFKETLVQHALRNVYFVLRLSKQVLILIDYL